MARRHLAPLPDDLRLRLRVQFTITRSVTAILRVVGLREAAIDLRGAVLRTRRRLFERCGSARYSSPALHGIDRELDRIIDRDCGYFVEAGGHDGYTQSNTYYLERFRGWTGVLVEPMRELADEARRNRPRARVFECALVGHDYEDPYVEMHFGDLFSNVAREDGATMRGRPTAWRSAGATHGANESRRAR